MMEIILFYLVAAIAIYSTVRVITNSNPVHALLNLVVSLLAVAMIFFMLGAPFAGALEIIVYAGAIMVLFVFVVMMLNLGQHTVNQEKQWLNPKAWVGASVLAAVLLAEMIFLLTQNEVHQTAYELVDAKAVGIALFGPYLLVVELASLLLLGALVAAYHLGKPEDE
jgi:NADH-quinone oxidoreductase subunit J